MATSSWTQLPVEGQPKELQDIRSAEQGLATVLSQLRKTSATGHKERIDLAALQKHTSTAYTQVEAVPDAVFKRLREQLYSVAPIILLPPGTPPFSTEAVVLFTDAHGSLKGLPVNKRGTMLLQACGLKGRGELRGDCFLAHIEPTASGVTLGSPFAPPKVSQRDWLEAAQKAHASGVSAASTALEATLGTLLESIRRAHIARDVAAKTAVAAVSPAAPTTTPTSTPPAAASDLSTDVSDPSVQPAPSVGCGEVSFVDAGEGAEVIVTILVPAGTKAKHISVKFSDTRLRVEAQTLPVEKRVAIDGELFQEGVGKDCAWELQDAPKLKAPNGERQLTLTLEKKSMVGGKHARWLMLIRS